MNDDFSDAWGLTLALFFLVCLAVWLIKGCG